MSRELHLIDKTINIRELLRLQIMLKRCGIPYEMYRELGGGTIKIPSAVAWRDDKVDKAVSVIQHFGSYGGREGRLELWTSSMLDRDEGPAGWLTAEAALEMILEEMNGGEVEE